MGLTCRLLGHSYGDTETEREREERGDEVVVSVRELQVCSRCGHEHVVTENKEVTAIRTPEEVGMTDGEADTVAAGFEPAEPKPDQPANEETVIETAPDPVTEAEHEAEFIDDAEDEDETDEVEADPEPEPEPETLDEPPVTDDAIILDDDGSDRDRTQWPDDVDEVETDDPTPQPTSTGHDAEFIDAGAEAEADADSGVTEVQESRDYGAWPDPPGEDEGFDARPDDGEPSSISFGGGLTPENDGAANAESNGEFIEAPSGSDDEFVRAGEAPRNSDVPDDAVEYYCPNCGHARGASSSSMRAGDICPECRKGYIAEREA
ncbi:hypothetical protein ACFQJC_14285 [Haloferax namakaokahaiae]|uniref:Oxidoreductase n=1 Tax=Haloferax namakaokahaiae TaxID=1748331 RepID=A0ABD5ZHA9_9EURY